MELTHIIALIGQATDGFPPCTVAVKSCNKISGHVGKGRAETVQWTKLASYEQEFWQRVHLSSNSLECSHDFFLNPGHVTGYVQRWRLKKTLQSHHTEGTSCPRLVPPLRLRWRRMRDRSEGLRERVGWWFLGIFAISSPLSSLWISTHAWNHQTMFEHETIQFTCRSFRGQSQNNGHFLEGHRDLIRYLYLITYGTIHEIDHQI